MLKFFDILVLLCYCAVIYWLSDQPSLPVPMLFEYQDKLHHFIAYFIMGIFAWRNFRHFVMSPIVVVVVSVVFCSFYGVSDEWHQSFVEGRHSDFLDWLADTTGASVALLLLNRLYKY
jgi:VanZ family protein